MNKKRIFGIVVVIVIIYFTYRYMKGLQQTASNTENSESNSERIDQMQTCLWKQTKYPK